MSKKRIFLIIAGALLLAFLLIFKYPKNFEDIIPDPYTFENNGVHICVGVGVAKTEENVYLKDCRVLFSTEEGHGNYDEIHTILSKAKFIADLRNLMPFENTYHGWSHQHRGGISITFGEGYDGFVVEIHSDGCVCAYKKEDVGLADYIYSYKLKDKSVFNEAWDYIVEKGEVYIMD